MKAIKYSAVACFAAAMFLAGCNNRQANNAGVESTIRDQDRDWSARAQAKDLTGILSYYADDAQMLPPNGPTLTGKQAITNDWTSVMSQMDSLSWQANRVDVSQSGDMAYVTGSYAGAFKGPDGKAVADKGKYAEVWKKQADGSWKVEVDMFSSDQPMPSAPAAGGEKKHSE